MLTIFRYLKNVGETEKKAEAKVAEEDFQHKIFQASKNLGG